MIEFFRDFLDGPIYFVVVVICVILIMAIIGYLMEKKRNEQEEKNKRVVIDSTPIETVEVREQVLNNNVETTVQSIPNPVMNQEVQLNQSDVVQNNNLVQQEQRIEQKENEVAPQPAIQVIDFGSTSNVDIEH